MTVHTHRVERAHTSSPGKGRTSGPAGRTGRVALPAAAGTGTDCTNGLWEQVCRTGGLCALARTRFAELLASPEPVEQMKSHQSTVWHSH